MTNFIEIKPNELTKNPFEMIGKEWMLVTAKKNGVCNTMTASWGGFGVMWSKPVAYIVIRPHRFTKEFIDASNTLSLTFFDERYRKELAYLGKVSGRDEDKIANAEFSIDYDGETPYFKEANTVLICKKLFNQPFEASNFTEKDIIPTMYPDNDFHTLYIVEIEKLLVRK
jgi:Conserved protein/domain typically associated with flavoprotein oxygenases, DIM6/NTAB family